MHVFLYILCVGKSSQRVSHIIPDMLNCILDKRIPAELIGAGGEAMTNVLTDICNRSVTESVGE